MNQQEAKQVLKAYEVYPEFNLDVSLDSDVITLTLPERGKAVFNHDAHCTRKIAQWVTTKPVANCSDEELEEASSIYFDPVTGVKYADFITEEEFDETAENEPPPDRVYADPLSFECDEYFHTYDLYLIRAACRTLRKSVRTNLVERQGAKRPIGPEAQAFLNSIVVA